MAYNASAIVAPPVVLSNYHDYDCYVFETHEWNTSNEVRMQTMNRSQMINNTPNYHTGRVIHHLRNIQMNNHDDWNALFGLNEEYLNPALRNYANMAIVSSNDDTHTKPFAGQMEVSLLMEKNYRQGIHLGVFIIHLNPHRRFKDGHMFQIEFGEGSATHKVVERLFDTNSTAIVLQVTEYELLEFLADDNEVYDLLYGCFMQQFNPIRYSYIESQNPNDSRGGYYVENEMAMNEHWWFVTDDIFDIPAPDAEVAHNNPDNNEAIVYIPPPPLLQRRHDNHVEQIHLNQPNNIVNGYENYIIENPQEYIINHYQ